MKTADRILIVFLVVILAVMIVGTRIVVNQQDRRLDALSTRLKEVEEKLSPNYIWATVYGDGDSITIVQPMQDVLARLDSLEKEIKATKFMIHADVLRFDEYDRKIIQEMSK